MGKTENILLHDLRIRNKNLLKSIIQHSNYVDSQRFGAIDFPASTSPADSSVTSDFVDDGILDGSIGVKQQLKEVSGVWQNNDKLTSTQTENYFV